MITAGAASARPKKTKRAEPTKNVAIFVSIPDDLLTSESTVQARTMGGETCRLESLASSTFETPAGPVSLFNGTLDVPVSTKALRYQYWVRVDRKSQPRCEWYSSYQSKDACRVAALSDAGSLIIDDEIMLERPGWGARSDFPRVTVLQQHYTAWIWDLVQRGSMDADEAARYLNAACSGKTVNHPGIIRSTNETRGGKSTEELKRANEAQLRKCAAETDDGKCTVACAALLARVLHAESSSARNSEPKHLVLVYTFCLNAWISDQRSLGTLSPRCRERVATGLVSAINAAHRKYDVDEQWMFALPLLHSVRVEPADHGISELLIKPRDTSSNFAPVLDRLRPLFAREPLLATSCFAAAPFRQAVEVVGDLVSARDTLRHWVIQINRKSGHSSVVDGTIEFLQTLGSMMEAMPQEAIPAVAEFLQQKAVVESVRRDWSTGSKLIALAVRLIGVASKDLAQVRVAAEHTTQAARALLQPLVEVRYPRYLDTFFSEFSIWQQLFDVQLPGQALTQWHAMVAGLLDQRLRGWKVDDLLTLFCNDRTDTEIKGKAYETLLNAANQAVQQLASGGNLDRLMSYSGKSAPRLFSTLINQAWMNFERRGLPLGGTGYSYALLKHSLEWKVFHSFFSVEMKAMEPQLFADARARLKRMADLYELLPAMLTNGDISVQALRLLATQPDSWKNNMRQVRRDTGGDEIVQVLEVEVMKRQEELREFEKFKEQVFVFDALTDQSDASRLQDQQVVKNLLRRPFETTSIKDLCIRQDTPAGSTFRTTFFDELTQHVPVDTLQTLVVCRNSLLFQQMFEAHTQRAPNCQINTWVGALWTPLLEEWTRFRDDIATGRMSVNAARETFADPVRAGTAEQELAILRTSTKFRGANFVRERTQQILDILKVDRNVNKGKAILSAARTLQLDLADDPEFGEIQMFTGEDYGRRPLSDLTAALVKGFDRIEHMSEHQAMCVEELSRHKELVNWMKPYQDTAQFETFTSLANAWVEQADDIELMADLHTVRTGCRRLLYEVNAGSSFKVLVEACSDEALEEGGLVGKIENCARGLEKLNDLQRKSVEDVKGTSFVQAESIYKTGTIHVISADSEKPRIEVRYKTLVPIKDASGKHKYANGELEYEYSKDQKPEDYEYCKDLRSKLMLVAGGSSAELEREYKDAVQAAVDAGEDTAAVDIAFVAKRERQDTGRKAVERFVGLLEATEGIVEILQKLQAAGCLAHATERFKYVFFEESSVPEARARRAALSQSYTEWLDQIAQLRLDHYELNAFSIVELTHLIRLGRKTRPGDAPHSDDLQQTLELLRCVSKNAQLEHALQFCETVAARLPPDTALDHEATRGAIQAIGMLLQDLASSRTITHEDRGRSDIFSHFLKENQVNCLVGLTEEETLSTVLSIYKPQLPRAEQMLLCAESTSAEAVKLLFRRCLFSDRRTFCLADVQNLSYEKQVAAVEEFERLLQLSQASAEPSQFRLILLSRTDDTHLCTALNVYNVPKDGFDSETRMTVEERELFMRQVFPSSRSVGSPNVLRVCGRAGDGKTHHVKNTQRLATEQGSRRHNVVLTEEVTKDAFVKKLVDIQDKLRHSGTGTGLPELGRADATEAAQLREALRQSQALADVEQAMRLSQAELHSTRDLHAFTCAACTLDNPEGSVACAACSTPRPATTSSASASTSTPSSRLHLDAMEAEVPLHRHRSSSSSVASTSSRSSITLGPGPRPPSAEELRQLTLDGTWAEWKAKEAWARRQGHLKRAADYLVTHADKDDDFWTPRYEQSADQDPPPPPPGHHPAVRRSGGVVREVVQEAFACGLCTFENPSGAAACAMCGTPAPAPAPAPATPIEPAPAPAPTPAPAANVTPDGRVLPEGWEVRYDETGAVYYQDHNTQTTHWQPPPPAEPASASSTSTAPALSNSRRESRRERLQETSIPPQLYIIDLSPTATGELSHMLFQLLMQSEIRSSDGRVFHRRPEDVFVVEHTTPAPQTVPTLDWLIAQHPLSPQQSIAAGKVEPRLPEPYHRVQYYFSALRDAGQGFTGREHSDVDCLTKIIEETTIVEPTWQQLTAFVNFMNRFLEAYEVNPFCGPMVQDDLPGFAKFVVEFLKVGARDFSLPTLGTGGDASPGGRRGGDDDGGDEIDAYRVRRAWESEDHPYVSFLSGGGFDFFGFHVDQHGNHVDPLTGAVKQASVMPAALAQTLYLGYGSQTMNEQGQPVLIKPMQADYHNTAVWDQAILRRKLFRIMNLETEKLQVIGSEAHQVPIPLDASDSEEGARMRNYILTPDNIKKILAIMYRFKVGIPVALCGHTGCGKTALVQFMCDAMAHDWNPDTDEHTYARRMVILKVHGGTTKDEIRAAVNETIDLARGNTRLARQRSSGSALYTVLFFDEVNTCDHQGYIKSLVCDNLLDGEPIDEALNLRFICALNPYEKHTDAMIMKLENAGLGYSVGTAGAKEKIGATPMRHLVYRVQQLPKSLRQCVWDFGTLSRDIEDTYIREMVGTDLVRLTNADRSALRIPANRYGRQRRQVRAARPGAAACPAGHELLAFSAPRPGFHCNTCGQPQANGNQLYGCRACDHDLCQACFDAAPIQGHVGAVAAPPVALRALLAPAAVDAGGGGDSAMLPPFDVAAVTALFSHCLSESQKMMRELGDECSFVSLRDIERALKIFCWFYEKRKLLQLENEEPGAEDGTGTIHPVTRCIILSLSVCYYSKLEAQRDPYRRRLAQWLQDGPQPADDVQVRGAAPVAAGGMPTNPFLLRGPNGADQIESVIKKCQMLIGKALQPTLPEAVALNDALCENCFLMVVAIETRTPLFLVGKPGSSKSLAKNAVCDAMHGAGSKHELFQQLKHVTAFSYQCSPLSKSKEIKKVFDRAQLFQDQKNDDNAVSVVVLDEIGLAEDSEYMPLKVLHSLLEPSDHKKSVAFIGISNWALDPAKMNRGIHVNRSTPGLQDLVDSALGICKNNPRVRPFVSKLAEAYSKVYDDTAASEYSDFFGL